MLAVSTSRIAWVLDTEAAAPELVSSARINLVNIDLTQDRLGAVSDDDRWCELELFADAELPLIKRVK